MELFAHQKEGIAFLRQKKKAILADEMGLGKTRQSILAAREEAQQARLVICPASLKTNWEREIHAVYPGDDVFVVKAGKEQDIQGMDWIVINYDLLPKYFDQLQAMKAVGILGAAICDEAHYIKGKKTVRSKLTLELVKGMPVVYMLTGTPIMNRPSEMFNLLKAIDHPLGQKTTVFAKRYCDARFQVIVRKNGSIIRFWDESGASNLEELRELTKDSILRRMKKDVLDLPAKLISVKFCQLTDDQRKEYDTAFDAYVEWLRAHPEEEKDIENIMQAQQLVELGKLKQVCSMAKVARIKEDVEDAIDQEQKVIIFTQYTKSLEAIAAACREIKGIRVATLSGESSQTERQHAVDSFQSDPFTKVFVANIKAGGVGLNLTAAGIVMFADMEWSPEIHSQAEDRAHRIGQAGTVSIWYYVMEETIEEDIVELLEEKRKVIREVMEGTRERVGGSLASDFLARLKQRMGTS